jgi:acetate---CoA ligase (ADP-forming)
MTKTDLKRFFNPRSIAIIGASKDIRTINGKPLHYLQRHGFQGRLFPVNPKYPEIAGLTCYPDIQSIDADIDLALIVVNYKLVPAMLAQCAAKKVPFVTIFSSGFAEAGEQGRRVQQQVAELAARSGIRICGPNCQGGVDLFHPTAAAFSAALDPKPFQCGPVGFVTQSGALGYSIFNMAQESGIGFSYVISTGNEMDLDAADFMDFMLDDENTRMVFAYLEGIRDGAKFVRLADKALAVGKPLAVLKVGRSETGSRAAASHTAALTGSDEVVDAFFRQKGIIRVDDIQGFIDLAKALKGTARIPQGRGLGIVSISGGGGVLCADTAEECGLQVATLLPQTSAEIARNIPPFGSPVNPVDVTAQAINTAEGFANVIQAMLADPGVDGLVVVVTMIVGEPGLRMARDLVRLSRTAAKPIVVAWTAGPRLMHAPFEVLNEAGVPLYQSPVRAVKALAQLMNYGAGCRRKSAAGILPQPAAAGMPSLPEEIRELLSGAQRTLSERQSKQLLNAFGVSTSRELLARSREEAVVAGEQIGFPVAMKVDSPDILHKTEADAIRLNVPDRDRLLAAFDEILKNARAHDPAARINGVLIQEMVPPGVEVIVGMNRDPQFGPVLMFGLGGIFVEIIKDVSLRIAPISQDDAVRMIQGVRGYPLLAGARGRRKADIPALAETLVKVSRMAVALGPRLEQLDINPLIVLPEGGGVKVADALVILAQG